MDIFKHLCMCNAKTVRAFSNVVCAKNKYSCKLLVVGGGAGGCSIAWRFSRRLKPKEIVVLEPSLVHYNQPQFTLVATGLKPFKDSYKPTASVLPSTVIWLKDLAAEFDPCSNVVFTARGDIITYDYMVVALGLKNDYDQIAGLKKALHTPQSPVSTIYEPCSCQKTWRMIKEFRGGLAIFTRPRQTGKCSGATHCVTYLADAYWRKHNVRNATNIIYATGDDVMYGVPKYSTALDKVAADRNVAVNYNIELVEVTARAAGFVDCHGGSITLPYNFLHVTPPMRPPNCLTNEDLVTESGYLDVDRWTLQHKRFANIFGIGDCVCTPNSKTAAAVAQQSPVVEHNLWSIMTGEEPKANYDGYGACPILTSYNTGMLAEFVYDKEVRETFPFDQSKESKFLYHLKKDIIPYLYWNKLIKGKWDGPARLRRIINPFGK